MITENTATVIARAKPTVENTLFPRLLMEYSSLYNAGHDQQKIDQFDKYERGCQTAQTVDQQIPG